MSDELFEEEYAFRKNPRESHPNNVFSILNNDEDPEPERYCMRHGGYMQQGPLMVKSNGAAYALRDGYSTYFCPCCMEEIYKSGDVDIPDEIDFFAFTKSTLKSAISGAFDRWDSGSAPNDWFVYVDEVEVLSDGESDFWMFGGTDETDTDEQRSLSEPSDGTKKMRVLRSLSNVETPITANNLSAQTELGGCNSHLSSLWKEKMVERRNVSGKGLEYEYWLSKYGELVVDEQR